MRSRPSCFYFLWRMRAKTIDKFCKDAAIPLLRIRHTVRFIWFYFEIKVFNSLNLKLLGHPIWNIIPHCPHRRLATALPSPVKISCSQDEVMWSIHAFNPAIKLSLFWYIVDAFQKKRSTTLALSLLFCTSPTLSRFYKERIVGLQFQAFVAQSNGRIVFAL